MVDSVGFSANALRVHRENSVGRVVESVMGRKLIVGKRNDLLQSNNGRAFIDATPRGSAMVSVGVDMVTNSEGERVIKGGAEDDTGAPRRVGRPRKTNEDQAPAEVG